MRWIYVTLVVSLLFLGLSGAPGPTLVTAQSFGPSGSPAFDRTACEQDCRYRYGVDPLSWRGGGSGWWHRYYACVQQCNDTFWKEFDRQYDQRRSE
ncbi:MAG: hypothetical protein FJ118_18390 [Deltaproteobacteria bacterium]|nr:hypothetical protein [Deltaproteobacteria bacterium]